MRSLAAIFVIAAGVAAIWGLISWGGYWERKRALEGDANALSDFVAELIVASTVVALLALAVAKCGGDVTPL